MSTLVQMHAIGQLCEFVKGTSPTLKTEPGEYPLVVTAAFRRTSADWQIEGPAVCVPLVSSTGHGDAALHRVHFQDGKFALANLLVALIPRHPTICDAKYLYHLLQAQKDSLFVPLMLGTANVSLKERDIASVEIPLPPLAEQHRIVARIEGLAAKVEEAKQLRTAALDEHNAVFGRALSALFDRNSATWTAATINDVAQSLDAGWSPQCEEAPAKSNQWGILKTTSVQWCQFRPHENKCLPSSAIERPELTVKAGDVLVTRAGPMKRVGVPATVREDHPKLMISDKLIRVRPKLDLINPRFLEYALSSPQAQEHLVARKTGLADAQVNISQAILRATPISFPSLTEQEQIIANLDRLQMKIEAVKEIQAETAAELDAILPAFLDKALKGEL